MTSARRLIGLGLSIVRGSTRQSLRKEELPRDFLPSRGQYALLRVRIATQMREPSAVQDSDRSGVISVLPHE